MKIKNLLPWNWRKNDVPVRRECMFESIGMFPRIDVRESDKETVIEAELPGMKKEDIEVSISNGALTIKAERREEKEKNRRGFYSLARSFSVFERTIPLPDGIDIDHVEASFKRGVLRVILPKTAGARERIRQIPVSVEA
jgi:HSP20 family protein